MTKHKLDSRLSIGKIIENMAWQELHGGPLHGQQGEPVKQATSAFRIEMPDGRGPYNDDQAIGLHISSPEPGYNCAWNANLNHEQCGVTEQAFRAAHGHAEYACDSTEAIADWFHEPARQFLKEQGARLIEYHVPAGANLLTIGRGEIVFNKHECEQVRALDLVTFKEIKQ